MAIQTESGTDGDLASESPTPNTADFICTYCKWKFKLTWDFLTTHMQGAIHRFISLGCDVGLCCP